MLLNMAVLVESAADMKWLHFYSSLGYDHSMINGSHILPLNILPGSIGQLEVRQILLLTTEK